VPVDAATIARAVPDTLAALAGTLPAGWASGTEAAAAVVTGLPVPTLNGVWALDGAAPPARLESALGAVAEEGVPFCLQARPECRAAAVEAAATLGLIPAPAELPLMVLDGPLGVAGAPGLTIRPLGLDESSLHGELAARAFAADPEVFDQVTDPALTLPGTRVYLGEVGGEAVTTALAVTVGEAVAVFNVATPPEYRRRGYGAAITGRILNDSLAAGASWAWLQSSPEGVGVYQRLGFRRVETWSCWMSD
jgi:GNAT superfamily N-acetyltransferase